MQLNEIGNRRAELYGRFRIRICPAHTGQIFIFMIDKETYDFINYDEVIKNKKLPKDSFFVRDMRNGEWFWIHQKILKKYGSKIKANGIAVYNSLASHSSNNEGKSFPSIDTIAEEIGVGRTTVKTALKLLVEYKLIRKERKPRFNIYYLLKI